MNKHCTLMFVLFCSFISFIYTDDKSPANLEDTCFDIDNTSLSKMVIKSSKCNCHNSFAKKKKLAFLLSSEKGCISFEI